MLAQISHHTKRYPYLLLVFFVVAELIVFPTDNFPLNDDWVYAKTLRDYFLGRDFHLITSNCTLWTQVMWGMLFTKPFGFSFGVLRLSTLVSSAIGVYVLYRLILQISRNPRLSFVAALTLLFNPMYFSLSQTYMTDVNFSTLFIAGLFFAYRFFERGGWWNMLAFMICSLLLILIRQFGIMLPLCFTFACLFLKERKWFYVVSALVLSALVFWGFKSYEHFLKTHERGPFYPFSSKFSLMDAEFWSVFWTNFKFRYLHIVLHAMVYTLPLVTMCFVFLVKHSRMWLVVVSLGVGLVGCAVLFADLVFPLGNIFVNMGLGAETFYEWLNPEVRNEHGHTYSATFGQLMHGVLWISVSLFFATLLLALVYLKKQGLQASMVFKAPSVFLIGLMVTYTFLLMISETFFDRYNLPMIILVLLALAYLGRWLDVRTVYAWLWLVPMMYVSVLGSKDYFELNRTRWQAYNYLRYEKGIPNKRINAGYEVDCWNDGYAEVYYKATFVHDADYLIQYRQVPEFAVYRAYEFQRYFPYTKDKIYIFVREQKLK